MATKNLNSSVPTIARLLPFSVVTGLTACDNIHSMISTHTFNAKIARWVTIIFIPFSCLFVIEVQLL